jgi:lipoate-protein ligase A
MPRDSFRAASDEKSHPDPHHHVALDAALFHALESTGAGETLRVWESQQTAVIVGALGSISRDIHVDACLADGVPIIRRLSGGGAVVVARGCLNYSLVLSLEARPELRHVAQSYRLILGRIVDALKVPGLSIQGLSDLAIASRKVSGSAQRRGRRALLHHGTFLYAFDIHSLERYLKEPGRQPAYRAGRRHAAFVTNAPLDPDAITAALIRAWNGEPEQLTRRAR